MSGPLGIILYRGPSWYNGKPIVAAVKFESANRKTGNVPNVAILPDTGPTYQAAHNAARSVCGACPLLGLMDHDAEKRQQGACYSWAIPHAVASQVRAIGEGRYVAAGPHADTLLAAYLRARAPRMVRLGTIGDAGALPPEVVARLVALVPDGTSMVSYTHDWRHPRSQHLRAFSMASVETEAEAAVAHAMGWRTYRAALPGEAASAGAETTCLYEAERLTCAACRLCDGASSSAPSVVATIHGTARTTERASAVLQRVRAKEHAAAT